jgi:hypothetical protein
MSTQRRVVRWQRLIRTEPAGTAFPSSLDAGWAGFQKQFRRATSGLTASFFCSLDGRSELATNSLRFSSSCTWRFCHGLNGSSGSSSAFCFARVGGQTGRGSYPALSTRQAGILPEQLPLISPLLSGASGRIFVRSEQSAAPQVLTGVCPRTERHYGQGNLYFKHAARNAACHSGRRSARRDLLRA